MVKKSVVVTGASSGIGWDTALAFARRGWRVAVLARRAEKLAELSAQVRQAGGECLELSCDVSRRADVEAALAEVGRAWGRLDALVNNAGINEYARFEDLSDEQIEEIVRINLLGPIYAIRAALPLMKHGHIVNVSSMAGLRGMPYMAVYSATKFGLVGLTESLRVELRARGVTLTAFCPGSVDTAMLHKAFADPKWGGRFAKLAKTSKGTAEKIVDATERRRREVVYGEVPGFVLTLAKLAPALADWLIHRSWEPVRKLMARRPAPAR